MNDSHPFFQSRRIGLCGSHEQPPSDEFVEFCRQIGRSVASFSGTIVVVAGRKLADSGYLEGVREVLDAEALSNRVETFSYTTELDSEGYVQVGRVIDIAGRSSEARRFAHGSSC